MMRIRATLASFAGLIVATLGIGCGNTVKDVCEDLSDKCAGVPRDECIEDGDQRQSTAEARGCDDAFDAYLDCVSNARCTWKISCKQERDTLESCAGAFPP
jgi:hypothetical protein